MKPLILSLLCAVGCSRAETQDQIAELRAEVEALRVRVEKDEKTIAFLESQSNSSLEIMKLMQGAIYTGGLSARSIILMSDKHEPTAMLMTDTNGVPSVTFGDDHYTLRVSGDSLVLVKDKK